MWLQVRGNAEEFVMYGLLHAAAASPRQLAIDMRDVPGGLWQHPFLQHALQVTWLDHHFTMKIIWMAPKIYIKSSKDAVAAQTQLCTA